MLGIDKCKLGLIFPLDGPILPYIQPVSAMVTKYYSQLLYDQQYK
jgi:hypothetical protein